MPIAVDAMGGDHAPQSAVEGAVRAAAEGASILLVGDRMRVEAELARTAKGETPKVCVGIVVKTKVGVVWPPVTLKLVVATPAR